MARTNEAKPKFRQTVTWAPLTESWYQFINDTAGLPTVALDNVYFNRDVQHPHTVVGELIGSTKCTVGGPRLRVIHVADRLLLPLQVCRVKKGRRDGGDLYKLCCGCHQSEYVLIMRFFDVCSSRRNGLTDSSIPTKPSAGWRRGTSREHRKRRTA